MLMFVSMTLPVMHGRSRSAKTNIQATSITLAITVGLFLLDVDFEKVYMAWPTCFFLRLFWPGCSETREGDGTAGNIKQITVLRFLSVNIRPWYSTNVHFRMPYGWAECFDFFTQHLLVLTGEIYGINKHWEVSALEQLTSHMKLNAGPQLQRAESPTITPPGMRWIQGT